MSDRSAGWHLGSTIAPPRFVMFCIVFAIGLALGIPAFGPGRGTLVAFDVASALFLISIVPLMKGADADQMRRDARRNDANRFGLLAITGLVMVVILVALAGELRGHPGPWRSALVIGTLALSWLFSNTVYALHYAHLYYLGDGKGGDCGGLDVPDCDTPDYWDFVYFSFTLGVAVATSDVQINSRRVRRIVIGQCIAGYVFNIGVIAFAISVLSGG